MLSLLCAVAIVPQATYIKPYAPSGPQIEVTMKKGGTFVITTDPKTSPKTVQNVLALVNKGFYNGQRVHRVEYWVTQWGDPQSKTKPMNDPKMGDGDSGHRVPFEMSDIDFVRGVVGIASDGLQNGGDSQLFVLKGDRLYLYHSYAVLGKITRGMDVVDSIKKGDRITSMRVLPSRSAPQAKADFHGTPYVWQGSLDELRERYSAARQSFRAHRDAATRRKYVAATNAYADSAMVSESLSPKERYPLALRLYREALRADRKNVHAKDNANMIERIYRQMGRPIPR